MSLTTENPALVPIISSEEIAAQLKAKYPNIEIFLLEVDMSDEKEDKSPNSNYRPKSVFQAVLKKPGRRELGLAMASGKDPLQMAESLIKSCWLEGDEEIKDLQYEDTIGLHACMQAMELLNVGNKGKLRKL
jgi:hypothetical protein